MRQNADGIRRMWTTAWNTKALRISKPSPLAPRYPDVADHTTLLLSHADKHDISVIGRLQICHEGPRRRANDEGALPAIILPLLGVNGVLRTSWCERPSGSRHHRVPPECVLQMSAHTARECVLQMSAHTARECVLQMSAHTARRRDYRR